MPVRADDKCRILTRPPSKIRQLRPDVLFRELRIKLLHIVRFLSQFAARSDRQYSTSPTSKITVISLQRPGISGRPSP
jgi:hypothetical protein